MGGVWFVKRLYGGILDCVPETRLKFDQIGITFYGEQAMFSNGRILGKYFRDDRLKPGICQEDNRLAGDNSGVVL